MELVSFFDLHQRYGELLDVARIILSHFGVTDEIRSQVMVTKGRALSKLGRTRQSLEILLRVANATWAEKSQKAEAFTSVVVPITYRDPFSQNYSRVQYRFENTAKRRLLVVTRHRLAR
jgi:hypothetical protein